MRISDSSSDVCSSDLAAVERDPVVQRARQLGQPVSVRRDKRQAQACGDDGRRQRHRSAARGRSEEHTSELQSLMRISYAVFCLKKKKKAKQNTYNIVTNI